MVQAAALLFHTIKACCWLIHQWMETSYWCQKSVLCVQRPTDWNQTAFQMIGWQKSLEVVKEAWTYKGECFESVSTFDLVDLAHSSAMNCTKLMFKKQPVDFIYSFLVSMCYNAVIDAEKWSAILMYFVTWTACMQFTFWNL